MAQAGIIRHKAQLSLVWSGKRHPLHRSAQVVYLGVTNTMHGAPVRLHLPNHAMIANGLVLTYSCQRGHIMTEWGAPGAAPLLTVKNCPLPASLRILCGTPVMSRGAKTVTRKPLVLPVGVRFFAGIAGRAGHRPSPLHGMHAGSTKVAQCMCPGPAQSWIGKSIKLSRLSGRAGTFKRPPAYLAAHLARHPLEQ